MKNRLVVISTANNIVLMGSSIEDALFKCVSILGKSLVFDRCYVLKTVEKAMNYFFDWCNKWSWSIFSEFHLIKKTCDTIIKMSCGLITDESIHGLVNRSRTLSFVEIRNYGNVKSYLYRPIFSNS